jgi:gliotoxin/aspirochlorine biosynthesis aminotransferase
MDFCLANICAKACVATRNKNLRNAVALVASLNVSTLSTIFSKELLASPRLPSLLQLSSTRLAEAYVALSSFFKASGIVYFPCNSTTFVMAKLAPLAQSWEDEAYAFRQYLQAGVLLAPGRIYHMPEDQKGWMRMSFAVDKKLLTEAITRIERVFQRLNPEKQADDPDRITS